MSQRPFDPANLTRTPRLGARLVHLDQTLVRAAHLNGLGTLGLGVALWLGFAFVADFFLGVPYLVRLLHLGALVGLTGTLGWRFWWRPIRTRPDARGLALLAESTLENPEELLISAVELQARPTPEGLSKLLREGLFEQAEQTAAGLSFKRLVDLGPPLRRLGLGGLGIGALALFAFASPSLAGIFFERLLGARVPWPQRTVLSLDLHAAEGRLKIELESDARGSLFKVALPRGSDLPITVTAEGQLPPAVWLDFDSGERTQLAASGPKSFATVLRGLTRNQAFEAQGGDDKDGRPRVEIEVLEPPDILATSVDVNPPAYSGLLGQRSFDSGTRALVGSRIQVALLPTDPEVTGRVRLLPADRTIELLPTEFPGNPARPDAPAGRGLGFEFVLEETTHLRFELIDQRGLMNPDPGLVSIEAQLDGPPELSLLAPGRSDVETVASGVLPLRALVEDDFGLASAKLSVRRPDQESFSAERLLEFLPAPVDSEEDSPQAVRSKRPARARALIAERLALTDLARWTASAESAPTLPSGAEQAAPGGAATAPDPAAMLQPGQSFELELSAADNHDPAQIGRTSLVRVRVLSDDEFLRRLQDRLAEARQKADALSSAQRERRQRVEELLGGLAEEGPGEALDLRGMGAALNGQRRIEADAEALLRELAAVAEGALYARLEPAAEPWLERLDDLLAKSTGKRFEVAPWRTLAELNRAEAGSSTLTGHLLDLVDIGIRVREDGAAQATLALASAGELLGSPIELRAALVLTLERQAATLTYLETLLERLKEWDNFQSVLALTRDILNRQKALQERLKNHASK